MVGSLNSPPYLPDDTHQERFIRPLLELEPSALSTVWFGGELVGFHSFVPLNEATRIIFQQNPVFTRYIKQTKPKEKEFVAWIGDFCQVMKGKQWGVQLRQLIYYFTKAHQIVGIGHYRFKGGITVNGI